MKENQSNPFQELFSELSKINNKIDALNEKIQSNAEQKTQQEFIAELPDNLQTKHLKKLFGKSHVTFWTWEKSNLLRPQYIKGRKFYAKADVLALVHQRTQTQK